MTKHIDAEKFEKDITGRAKMLNGKTYFECDFIYQTLWNQLTADVAEVKHGEWTVKHVGVNFNKERLCTNCKKVIEGNHWNYCSYCGAEMDGKKEVN